MSIPATRGGIMQRFERNEAVTNQERECEMTGMRLVRILIAPVVLCAAIMHGDGAARADDNNPGGFPAAAQQATGMPSDGMYGTGADIDPSGDALHTTITVQTHISSVGVPPLTGDQLPGRADLSAYNPPVGAQGGVGSCASWAIGYYLAGWWARAGGYYPAAVAAGPGGFAPMYLYSQISATKSHGQDNGSTLDDNLSLLQQQGIDAESDYTQGTQDFTDLPTTSEGANASQYKVASYQTVLKDQLDHAHMSVEDYVRTNIANGSPVVIAMKVDQPFINNGNASYSYFDSMGGANPQGHAMFASAYDENGLWVENSWGTGWGHNGYAELSWNLVNSAVLEIGTLLPGTARNAIPAPAGAQVALVARNSQQEDAFFAGSNGALFTTYEVNDGAWSAPIALTAAGVAPAGAPVAASVRNDHQEDVFYVGNDGKLYTLFEANDGPWSAPIALTTAFRVRTSLPGRALQFRSLGVVSPGADIAVAVRNDQQEDVFFIGGNGVLYTLFEANDGAWSDPIALTAAGAAPANAPIAAAVRNDHQEDVFYAGSDGALYTIYEVSGGAWSAPLQITNINIARPFTNFGRYLPGRAPSVNVAPAGAHLAAVVRNDHQEDVFFAANNGALYTNYEVNDGAWSTPIALTAANVLPAGGMVAGVVRNDHQEDVFFVGQDGALYTTFEAQDGPWSDAIALSQAGLAPAGAALAAARRNDHQEDVFLASAGGALATADEVRDGGWVLISPLLGFS